MDNNHLDNNKNSWLIKYKTIILIMVVILLIGLTSRLTYAFYYGNKNNTNTLTGNTAVIDLDLTVQKILPTTNGIDNIIVTNFNDLAESLNDNCSYRNGEFALCQLYKITLENNSGGLNTDIKGSVSFNNENAPNLSWILINNYNSSTTYTDAMMGTNFNTATSSFTNFVDSYLLMGNTRVDYYMLVWVNETETVQNDQGGYSGTIRFEGANGQGVTASFAS